MPGWPKNIAIIIPAYNSEKQLKTFLPQLCAVVPRENILVVDDCSEDDTRLYCLDENVHCIRQKKNFGKGRALKTGFVYWMKRGVQWIITMDADGQHSIEDLPRFRDAIERNDTAGIIIGKRDMTPRSMPLARIFSNRTTSFILSLLSGTSIKDSQCGYRAYSVALIKNITIQKKRFEMESEVILKSIHAGFSVRFVPVQTLYLSDISHISHVKDTVRWVLAVLKIFIDLRRNKRNR